MAKTERTTEQKERRNALERTRRVELTPEEKEWRKAYHREWRAQRTPEEKERDKAYHRELRAQRTPEEIEGDKAYQREWRAQWRAQRTPEEKERDKAYHRQWWAQWMAERKIQRTPLTLEEKKERKRAYERARREQRGPEEKKRKADGQRARLARRGPEQIEKKRAYTREYMRGRALNATPEEKAAKLEAHRQWYYSEKHDEMLAALRDKRRDGPTREKHLEAMRNWNAANKEYRAEYMRQMYLAKPEQFLANNRNRKARIKSVGGKHTQADVSRLFATQRGVCAGCDALLVAKGRGKYHVDHVMPLALGGSNWPENLQLLCPPCNLSKHAQHPTTWVASRRIA